LGQDRQELEKEKLREWEKMTRLEKIKILRKKMTIVATTSTATHDINTSLDFMQYRDKDQEDTPPPHFRNDRPQNLQKSPERTPIPPPTANKHPEITPDQQEVSVPTLAGKPGCAASMGTQGPNPTVAWTVRKSPRKMR
jgi:hypothetical protein